MSETRHVPRPIQEAFAYTADFSHIADWDPGVEFSEKTSDGPVGLGSTFRVIAAFGPRRVTMIYTITEFDPPNRVVLRGEADALTAVDEIRFFGSETGTDIHYTADLTFYNFIRYVAPIMGPIFDKVGRKAMDGLARTLRERP